MTTYPFFFPAMHENNTFSFTSVCDHGDNKRAFMFTILGVFWTGIVRITGIAINEAYDGKRKVENVPVFS
ncbi:MAG: hypothetical protein H8E61_02755 [Bacteroidetes bacterium]|nr:hypothetical protein [Bacteroidota bacterium]